MSVRANFRAPSLLLAIVALLLGVSLTGTATAAEAEAGASWVQQSPAANPPARHGAAMAFDQATGRLVLFGGVAGGTDLGDTWTYDGTDWTKQSPANSPSARHGASMAFDQATGQLVLFGGTAAGTDLGDTWAYDGTTWTKQSPAESPLARHGASMAFDQATGQLVLFGGSAEGTDHGDTWTYAAGTWTRQSPTSSPSPRDDASLSFDLDSGRLVLFGGAGENGLLGDTWTYDGTNWTEATPATTPTAREGAAMTFDQTIGKTILVGGNDGGPLGDVWTFEKGTWARQEIASVPPPRGGASLEFDPASGQTVLFGGSGGGGDLSETWTFGSPPSPSEYPTGSDFAWYRQSTEARPSARWNEAMAFDPAIGQIVLYGGRGQGLPSPATWTYDGDNWIRHLTTPSPPPPGNTSIMAFDPALGKMILYSSGSYDGPGSETWIYDGSSWTELSPAQSPPSLYAAAMAFDSATGQLILHGRGAEDTNQDETWTFDGTTWNELRLQGGPYGLAGTSMAFDPSIGKIVLFGDGPRFASPPNETWTFDGTRWTEESLAGGPEKPSDTAMTYDSTSGEMLLLASGAPGQSRADVWAYVRGHWLRQDPGEPPFDRREGSFVFDPATGRSILLGTSEYEDLSMTLTYQRRAVGPTSGAHPRAGIFGPVDPELVFGETVTSDFGCSEIEGGPGIRSCTDSGGASAPHGSIDTSALGEHTYMVTAVSKNGSVGTNELLYIVKKRPELTVHAPKSVRPGEQFTATATLSGGASPTGTLTFFVSGPNSFHCVGPSQAVVKDELGVSGNGTYEMTRPFTASLPGSYTVFAKYSGDYSNFTRHSECDEADDLVTVGKVTTKTDFVVSPNPARPYSSVLLSAHVFGSEPTGTISIEDGSRTIRTLHLDPFRGTAEVYETFWEGKHKLRAVYSGDDVNPPSSSPVIEEIVSEETSPPNEPEEVPVLPSEPEKPVVVGPENLLPPREMETPPVISTPTVISPPSSSPAPTVDAPAPSEPTPAATAPIAPAPGISVSHRVSPARNPLYTFTFASSLSGTKFFCGLDRHSLVACHSPTTYRRLSRGSHRFVVKAVGPTGSESAPRVVRFFVGRHPNR